MFGRRGYGAVKRKIKSKETTRWNINEAEVVAKWLRLAETVEKQSRYTICNNGTNICCVGRWQWFITVCELHARNKCRAYAWQALLRHEGRAACLLLDLVIITGYYSLLRHRTHETLRSSSHRACFHDLLFHRSSLRGNAILNERRVSKKKYQVFLKKLPINFCN